MMEDEGEILIGDGFRIKCYRSLILDECFQILDSVNTCGI